MTNLQYTICETTRTQNGDIVEIDYEYDETKFEQIHENMQSKQVKLEKNYRATFKRDEYNNLARQIQTRHSVLPFDTFVRIIRPFMMGTYAYDEIRQAFHLLATNGSITIDVDQFLAFTSVIHPNMTTDTILNYIRKVSKTGRSSIDFDEFVEMVLEGIGRDMVCGQV